MKQYILIAVLAFVCISCSGQKNNTEEVEINTDEKNIVKEPKGTWKVDKEFDENGNLIRYDSIYSWSSNSELDNLSSLDKDSLMQSFKSRFYTNFSKFENEGFEAVFSQDSLFSKHFFNDDFFDSSFGKDFMDIDKVREQMIARQKQFLKKYQSQIIKPEAED
ncbi:hypothetical protein [Pontimicrobium sp. MEBiC01747]